MNFAHKAMDIQIRDDIRDFMEFEEATSIIYPFAAVYEELSEGTIQAIVTKCEGHRDTETLYEAIQEIVGYNPKLDDPRFVEQVFAARQRAAAQNDRQNCFGGIEMKL